MNSTTTPITLSDALRSVDALSNMIPEKSLAPQSSSIGGMCYSCTTDKDFCDKTIFNYAFDRYLQESIEVANLMDMIEKSKKFSSMLYTWRSCTIPIPKNMPNEGKPAVMELLEKEVKKLIEFYQYQRIAVEKLRNEISRLTNASTGSSSNVSSTNEYISKTYISVLCQFISSLATLDELKNIKASIKNDFAHYKRSLGKTDAHQDYISKMRELSLFLGTHNSILTEVKKLMTGMTNHEDFLCHVIMTCVTKYEQKCYLMPEEKYDLVKVTGFVLFLLDGPKFNINKAKKLNIPKIDNMLKEADVIPLYGDMTIRSFNYIQKTVNYEASYWPKCSSSDPSPQSSLVGVISTFRQQHSSVVMEFTEAMRVIEAKPTADLTLPKISHTTLNSNNNINIGNNNNSNTLPTTEQLTAAYNISIQCLQTLSCWTSAVVELVSWKLTHPAELKSDRPGSVGAPAEATAYERVTKYNYSSEEKSALVELIGFIKGLYNLLHKNINLISSYINIYVYKQLQHFVNVELSEPLRKANKHHKDLLISLLSAIQNTCMDQSCLTKKDTTDKKVKKSDPGVLYVVEGKQAPPSNTQLYLVRSMLDYLINHDNKVVSGKHPCKDLESQHIKCIREFLISSHMWKYAMRLQVCLDACSDLSQLWYRECYLEMTKGEEIQFPIEQSLPWILVSHILEKRDPYLIHFVLYMFDMYNDSAHCSLYTFKKQHLFQEVEAEAILCFEQLVFQLSEYIYERHKVLAANIVLNKKFGKVLKKINVNLLNINYLSLMLQKNVQLLGRSVDLHQRITQSMNDLLIKSLNIAISRFEFSDVTGIVELETLVRINKETHKLLSKHLRLDDFNNLWQEANTNVTAPYGRTAVYILLELTSDFLPHYCYNSSTGRFVHTVLPFADKTTRDRPPNVALCHLWGNKALAHCFQSIHSMYTNFFGLPHFTAMVELMGYQDVAMLTKELMENMRSLIKNTLVPYTSSLQSVMPEKCILPRYDYTSPGVLGYYEMQLEAILTYSDLQPKVFQCLREIGNSILFVMLIEQYQSIREMSELQMSAIFLKVIPRPYVPEGDSKDSEETEAKREKMMIELEHKYRMMNVQAVMSKNSREEDFSICKENILLTRDKLSCGLYIFRTFLQQLQDELFSVEEPIFSGNSVTSSSSSSAAMTSSSSSSSSAALWCVQNNKEFHRVWSAMQFVMCRTLGQNELTVEELFGEGINWGGCAIVFLLKQHRRFQMMDCCYHLYKVNRVDQIDKMCAGVPLRKMVDRIRKFQILNDQIFCCLEKHFTPSDQAIPISDYGVEVELLDPLEGGVGGVGGGGSGVGGEKVDIGGSGKGASVA